MTETTATNSSAELSRLRNRHVAKLLEYLGDTPPYLEQAIKRQFTMFANDVMANIIEGDYSANTEDIQRAQRIR